ncbi:hypothetical protein GDR29_19575 [Xanthomonas oryzae pv. oryzae]|nr:hypothetical protein GDR29_19575 [Xanthomonas oryzae pv. oryzae]
MIPPHQPARLTRCTGKRDGGIGQSSSRSRAKSGEQKRSKQLGRRAHNRSGRVVHADSEHRPRPPGGERSRFVSCYKSAALPAVAVITLVCSIATRCSSTGDPEDDMQSPAGDDARRPRYS